MITHPRMMSCQIFYSDPCCRSDRQVKVSSVTEAALRDNQSLIRLMRHLRKSTGWAACTNNRHKDRRVCFGLTVGEQTLMNKSVDLCSLYTAMNTALARVGLEALEVKTSNKSYFQTAQSSSHRW